MATTIVTPRQQGFAIRWRYVIIVALLVPVLGHLFIAISRSPLTNYYVTVDELLAQNTTSGRVRVGAPVVPASIEWDNKVRSLTFQLVGNTRPLTVTYRGFAPDSFREGTTVIVEGELNRDGTFIASNLLVKCPHQYVPAF